MDTTKKTRNGFDPHAYDNMSNSLFDEYQLAVQDGPPEDSLLNDDKIAYNIRMMNMQFALVSHGHVYYGELADTPPRKVHVSEITETEARLYAECIAPLEREKLNKK